MERGRKRKIQDTEIFSKCMSNKEIKLLKTILMYTIGVYLPIFFVVVTMNSKWQVNGKLGHVVQIHFYRFP